MPSYIDNIDKDKINNDTLKAIKSGDYRGQRLLVPAEQAKSIRGSLSPERTVATKLAYDGIEGRELTYSEAKNINMIYKME